MEKIFESKTFELSYAEYMYILKALKIFIAIFDADGTCFSFWSLSVLKDLLSKFEGAINED